MTEDPRVTRRRRNLDAMVAIARAPQLPPLAFDLKGELLAEVEEALPDVARQIEAWANGIPINGAAR